ncbi:helix-turn-helix domain-containing protein [Aestuariibacter sp. A3R04]|uniref:helix-turn-helix domain-containing protein n=1 Tax=Aestuariibacter sp. A3R04 TaxID=2841571 RepID=UPI001C097A31|nr:AraC family transcriptional regulator [Aestuariibacter sp. A3R04]MBU3021333.1 AraC family transcriptional regulator [Aestuariibacter sp. A3R04]
MKTVLFNTHDLVLLFTVYQCLLFALFLVTLKRGKRKTHLLLAAFLLSQAAIPMDNLINFGEMFRSIALDYSPNLFYSFGLAYWIEAPLLLFYIRSLIYKDYQFRRYDLLFFIPVILYTLYFANNWWLQDEASKIAALQGDTIANTPFVERAIYLFREIYRVACGILCLVELNNYQKQLKQQVAETESVDLTWLKILVVGFLIVRVIAVITALAIISAYEIGFYIDHEAIGLSSNYAVMLIVSGLIFFSAGYSAIFRGIDSQLSPATTKDKPKIDPRQVEKITRYMQLNKPYLNHLLTLENLANQLDISPRVLSHIINHHFNKNFFEFINHYRIEESKLLLESESNRKTTMLDIMDAAGFNSKATFNTFFKKLVGKTPTQYRKDYWE